MGYTTNFSGQFDLDRALKPEHAAYLRQFGDTRRMKRSARKAVKLPDPVRIAAGLPIGQFGEFYVGAAGYGGQDGDFSVLDYNAPPPSQPGLWCQWMPTEDGLHIEWDGSEKFYHYTEWLVYLVEKFLKPWGYVLSGEVFWEGEDSGDLGKIAVVDNEVRECPGRVVYDASLVSPKAAKPPGKALPDGARDLDLSEED